MRKPTTRPVLPWLLAIAVVASVVLPMRPAGASTPAARWWPPVWSNDRFNDPSGDSGLGGYNGDLRDVGAVYRGHKITLAASVYGNVDSRTDDQWRNGSYALAWFLDTDGDKTDDWEVDYYNTGDALVADVVDAHTGEVSCQGEAANNVNDFFARLDAACLGTPNGFGLGAAILYATQGAGEQELIIDGDQAPDDGTYGKQYVRAVPRSGYWMVGSDGRVYPFGDATAYPVYEYRTPDPPPPGHSYCFGAIGPVADIEPTPRYDGYWVADRFGHVRTCGTATGIQGGPLQLAQGEEIASLSAVPDLDAYNMAFWLFTTQGRVIPINGAPFFGDLSGRALNGPVLDSVASPSGQGYYMVGSDGGVFTFGDAVFRGSTGDRVLNKPVQSLVPNPKDAGYWLVASDGGVFAFGDAPFRGSMGDKELNKPITGMVAFGNGYLMVGEDGGIFNFSDRDYYGSLGDRPPSSPIVSVASLDEATIYNLH